MIWAKIKRVRDENRTSCLRHALFYGYLFFVNLGGKELPLYMV